MEYKNSIEAVYIQLNDIMQDIAQWGSDENPRNIDIDLALSKLRDIYDTISSIKKEQMAQTVATTIRQEDSTDEEIVKTDNPESIDPTNTNNTIEFEIEESPTHEETKPHQKEIIKEQVKKAVRQEERIDSQSKLSDQFKAQPTLNEELSSHVSSEDLAIKLKTRPIKNLSSAIGLNEKFEFINTLFHGDKDQYEETIEVLNQATNFNEAYNYLSSKLNWDMSAPLAQRILELIRRKLIINNE